MISLANNMTLNFYYLFSMKTFCKILGCLTFLFCFWELVSLDSLVEFRIPIAISFFLGGMFWFVLAKVLQNQEEIKFMLFSGSIPSNRLNVSDDTVGSPSSLNDCVRNVAPVLIRNYAHNDLAGYDDVFVTLESFRPVKNEMFEVKGFFVEKSLVPPDKVRFSAKIKYSGDASVLGNWSVDSFTI